MIKEVGLVELVVNNDEIQSRDKKRYPASLPGTKDLMDQNSRQVETWDIWVENRAYETLTAFRILATT